MMGRTLIVQIHAPAADQYNHTRPQLLRPLELMIRQLTAMLLGPVTGCDVDTEQRRTSPLPDIGHPHRVRAGHFHKSRKDGISVAVAQQKDIRGRRKDLRRQMAVWRIA